MLFENLELIHEYPGWFLQRTKPLRIYKTTSTNKDGTKSYRLHFGYPEEFIKPFCPLIESTPFWGEQHWTEHEGFWVFPSQIALGSPDEYPVEKLNKENAWRRDSFAKVLDFYQRAVK